MTTPEEFARRRLTKIFSQYGYNFKIPLNLDLFCTDQNKADLELLLTKKINDDIFLHNKYYKKNGEYIEASMDYEDTLSSDSDIADTLTYISDRWNSTGRLKYLMTVISLYESGALFKE